MDDMNIPPTREFTDEERQRYRHIMQDKYVSGEWKIPQIFLDDPELNCMYFNEHAFDKEATDGSGRDYLNTHQRHWVHVSVHPEKPDMIAYTRSLKDGMRDRQVRVKLGRYLVQTFGDRLSDQKIAQLVAQHNEHQCEKLRWHIAMTPKRIETVYQRGPNSCMSKPRRYFDFRINDDHDAHPTSIYGAGDLGVAFLWRGGRITARALVWPERKVYGRVYGDSERLCRALHEAGYQDEADHRKAIFDAGGDQFVDGGFNGARLLKLEVDDVLVAPYMDEEYGIQRLHSNVAYANSGFAMMTMRYDDACAMTNGLSTDHGDPCSECGDNTPPDEQFHTHDGEMICDHCRSMNYFWCEDTDELYHIDELVRTYDHRCISQEAYENGYFTCEDTDEVYPNDMLIVTHDHKYICRSAYENDYFTCSDCGEVYPNEDANVCPHTGEVRCNDCHAEYREQNPELFEDEEHEQEAA